MRRFAERLVCGVILAFGALMVALTVRADDFFTVDVTYFELARSMIVDGSYGFSSQPIAQPPGFPALLAFVCVAASCSYKVLIRIVAVGATLGLLTSYKLLRREHGPAFAGVVCILLASSPSLFKFSTRLDFSDAPYFFASMAALVAASRLERARRLRARVALGLLCGFFLVGSVLIRSAGLALVIGLGGWLAASWWADREGASRRLKTFLPLLLAGLVVQASWMHWGPRPPLEWPSVGGYPQSYLAQLTVKSGNRPELGTVSLSDVPARVAQNVKDRMAFVMVLLTHLRAEWFSALVPGLAVLMLTGVWVSLRRGGGSWPAWYFVGHEAMYAVWPWNFEERFFLPVAPLACLYLWRGAQATVDAASRQPRVVGAASCVVAVFSAAAAGAEIWASGSWRPIPAAIVGAVLAITCAWVAWTGRHQLPPLWSRWPSSSTVVVSALGRPLTFRTLSGAVALVVLVGIGVVREVSAGRENLAFDVTREATYPDVEAGRWIHAHTPATAVVMARQLDVVYHYGRRRVVWFPPLRDPQQLMEGIRRHRVEFVVVIDRESSYWLPPEGDCFNELTRAYPGRFGLVHESPRLKIFRVSGDS